MNYLDALRIKRRYRRPKRPWSDPIERHEGYNEVRIELDDLLADDWEIEEAKVEITRTQFYAAYEHALKLWDGVAILSRNPQPPKDLAQLLGSLLAQELGLEPKP